jgi:hypothetical protein
MELREATAKVKQTKRQALYNIRFKSWWPRYINRVINYLDITHRPVFFSKTTSGRLDCLHPPRRYGFALAIGPNSLGFFLRTEVDSSVWNVVSMLYKPFLHSLFLTLSVSVHYFLSPANSPLIHLFFHLFGVHYFWRS